MAGVPWDKLRAGVWSPGSELPEEEGERGGPSLYLDDIPPAAFFDGRATLADVARDGYTLFSALVFQAAGLPFDPVMACWAERNLPEGDAPAIVEVGAALLHGLPPPYDRVVFACPGRHAQELFRYLDRIGVSSGGDLYRSIRQEITCPDPLAAARWRVRPVGPPPLVKVHLYGLTSDTEVLSWSQPKDPLTKVPRLSRTRLSTTSS